MEEKQAIADLMAQTHNLGISLMAINTRLALVEAFNSQLTQGQIDMKDALTKLMKASQKAQEHEDISQVISELVRTVNQLKATQNMLMIRQNASKS